MRYLHDWYLSDDGMAQYGSKAANLGKLMSEGFRVPNGIAIKPNDSLMQLGPDFIQGMLDELTRGVGRKPSTKTYAVRSSGLAEDGEDSSYAGQHDTYLNVNTSGILSRVISCRESSVKAKAYRDAKGETDQGIAVLVQMMVPSWISGVTFTSDPFNMDLGTSVIEYTKGLGDKLVAGEVDPTGSYEVSNISGLFSPTIADDDYKIIRALTSVHDTCKRIADLFGKPMDIEWAWDDEDRLWILQARPLTTGGRRWLYPEMRGRSVVKGRAEGIARWAQGDAENMMFDEGNILLATMTNPHMVPLMMKASGIATRIGGRTCHAAIVSRELNKPCVVGVGNLNALQNNTKVVLDATAGVVIA